jgi:peptidoglycan-N-acetylglucosamine deacetylase
MISRVKRRLFRPIERLRSDDAVALTFDDGPDRELDSFLSILGEAGAQATFFVVGEQVERSPSKLQEIVSCGHEVAVHCYRHRNYRQLRPAQAVEDMRRARAVIEDMAERCTERFRPPFGSFSLASWLEASRQGWERVLWTRDSRDWEARATPQFIVDSIGWPNGGDIILLHDSARYAISPSSHNTLKALPVILERISTLGLAARSIHAILEAERR